MYWLLPKISPQKTLFHRIVEWGGEGCLAVVRGMDAEHQNCGCVFAHGYADFSACSL